LGFLGFARNNRLFGRWLAGNNQPANQPPVVVTQPQPLPPIQNPQDTALPPQPIVTTVGGVIVPPEVADAQKRASDNPNDLNAQLDLALAYWNFNWQKETYETLGNIIKLAGMDNRDFFVQAGDKFKGQRDGWLPAASMYFQAVRSYALSGNVPNPLIEAFHESYYKGADKVETPLIVPFERVSQVDEAIALVARARNMYYTKKVNEAFKLFEQAKQLEPNMRELFLLEGELAARQGDQARAKLVLSPLVKDTASTPEWIRICAQQILDGLK
jgi:tetratricopeptide (TPR) repeat protein